MGKRLFDLFFSSLGLVLTAPLFLIIAVWIKLDDSGPVFYRGERIGRGGRPFRIFKFRSMIMNAEQIGGSSTSREDPRITRPGRFIRRYKLDELSQLFNVFLGQMSLVGPRPEVRKYVEQYSEEEKAILTVRPGITDWASIWNADEGAVLSRYPDPDRAYEEIIRPVKLRLQLAYVRHHSIWVDIKIIFCTLIRLVKPEFRPKELAPYPSLLADAPLPADSISIQGG